MTIDRIHTLCRWGLGLVFIIAGGAKLASPATFATLIDAYGIAPEGLLMPVAVALPLIEVVAGIGMLFDMRGSLSVITVLLLFFIVILSYGLWMGLDVDCGCFSPGDPEAKAFHGLRAALYRDLFMLAVVMFVYFRRHFRAIQRLNGKPAPNNV